MVYTILERTYNPSVEKGQGRRYSMRNLRRYVSVQTSQEYILEGLSFFEPQLLALNTYCCCYCY